MSNCNYLDDLQVGENSVLAWNLMGTIQLRKTQTFCSIEVHFSDTNFHRNITMNDDFKVSMASMNYSGMVLASCPSEDFQDAYQEDQGEDEHLNVDKTSSYLYFKQFDERKMNNDWHFAMPHGENIDACAVGTEWVACCTDAGFLRVFSHEGVQKHMMNFPSKVVSMTGYESFIVIVYHGGLPIMEHQQLQCQIIDCNKNQYKQIYSGFCPISKNSNLDWLGFSDEGMLVVKDDFGVLSSFNFKNKQWIPILDLKQKFEQTYKNIWIVGFMDHQLMYIELPRGCDQPPDQMRAKYKIMPLKVPFLMKETDDLDVGENKNDENKTLMEFEEEFFRNKVI